jgi:hypothetical protein
MKASRKIKNISLAIIGLMIVSANYSFSQDEYDDMYFRPDDRKEMKFNDAVNKGGNPAESFENKTIAKNTNSDVINPSYSPNDYGNLEENYSAKNVNPEYIARYKSNPKGTENTEELNEGDSYYDKYYDRKIMPGEGDESTGKHKYNYPNSYYGGYNAMRMSRMYGNPWYDPFYGGFGPSWSLGLGYTFGYMPGFSMGFGYGTGWGYNPYGFYNPWGYGYSPYMSSFYDPFYSPWGYDPFYSSWGYDPFYSPWGYNSMYSYRYPYGYPYYGYPSYGLYSGYTIAYINNSNNNVVNKGTESNRLAAPSYRNRVSRGSDQITRENQAASTSRTIARKNSGTENQSLSNARTASERDFSRSQNEYYSRNGSRNTTLSSNPSARTATLSSPSHSTSGTYNNTNTARVRSTRTNTDYARPSYQQSTREQRAMSSGSSGRSSLFNSGTYRSTRSSGSSYTPSRSMSSGSSFSGSSGSSFRSSGGSSSGSFSGGSRSSGYSSGSSRSSRGNR